MTVQVPLALVEGFAAVWCRLAGGHWRSEELEVGTLVVWTSPEGHDEALPDRMYGLSQVTRPHIDVRCLPEGVAVNLPPGVTADGAAVHAVGHRLVAEDREAAWGALRRVGRQGVSKAQRTGCMVTPLADAQYVALASAKAARFGAPPPPTGGLLRASAQAQFPTLNTAFTKSCL